MAVGPFGPWVEPGPASGPSPDELGLGGGPGDPFTDGETGPPETGTALDEFLPIYWYLARATSLHPAMSPGEVDELDITVAAMLLGVQPESPDDPFGPLTGDFAVDSARLIARRQAAAAAARSAAP